MPLHYASESKDWRIIRLLLQHGADPDAADAHGNKAVVLQEQKTTEDELAVLQRLQQGTTYIFLFCFVVHFILPHHDPVTSC
jgi:Ankyrin repeat